jgi:hypothetical protein
MASAVQGLADRPCGRKAPVSVTFAARELPHPPRSSRSRFRVWLHQLPLAPGHTWLARDGAARGPGIGSHVASVLVVARERGAMPAELNGAVHRAARRDGSTDGT